MENSKVKERNSSIELLRIIAMIGVVILHYNNDGMGGGLKYVAHRTLNQQYIRFTEAFFTCAVNLFIMISAYFLSCTQKRKLSKAFELIFQVIIFRLLFYAIDITLGKSFSFNSLFFTILPSKYFVILYTALYIISPYINTLLKAISKEQFKKLTLILFLLFSVQTILVDFFGSPTGLSAIGYQGSQSGYTIVNFTLVYIIGAYIRINEINLAKKQSLLGIAVCSLFIFLQFDLESFFCGSATALNYNHPIVILMPVFVILLFKNFNFKSSVINELAKAAFTCYLFHTFFMPRIMVEQFVNRNIFILITHQFGSAILLYLVSYVVYKIYTFVTVPMLKRISPKIDNMGKYIY